MGKEPVINNVPYIVGFNNTEGHGLIVEKELKGFKSGITKEVYEESLKNYVGGWFYVSLSFMECSCLLYWREMNNVQHYR